MFVKQTIQFTIHVKFSEEDNEYVATCDEFPGLSWLDYSPAKAFYELNKLITQEIANTEYGNQKVMD